jgi:hypothetical protein
MKFVSSMVIAIAVMIVAVPVIAILPQPVRADDDSEPQCYAFCGGSTFSLHFGFGANHHHHN